MSELHQSIADLEEQNEKMLTLKQSLEDEGGSRESEQGEEQREEKIVELEGLTDDFLG